MDHTQAVERVEKWLTENARTFKRLDSKSSELPASLRSSGGSSILLQTNWMKGGVVLWFRPLFPMRPPQIYFAEGFLPQQFIPHVNSEGQICTLPNGVTVNPAMPEDQVHEVLKIAELLITKNYTNAELIAQVEDELYAYWTLSKSPVVFLVDDTIETHSRVKLTQKPLAAKKDCYLVQPWTERLDGEPGIGVCLDIQPQDFVALCSSTGNDFLATHPAFLIALKDIVGLADRHGRLLRQAKLFVFFRCRTSKQDVWLAGTLKETPSLKLKHRDVFVTRTLDLVRNGNFLRCGIEDLRTRRLLRRAAGQAETDSLALFDYKIAFVGCGSVGSTLAGLLFTSGITNCLLIDQEELEPANLGRHLLDRLYLYMPKSEAMKYHLGQRFPQAKLESIKGDIRMPEVIKRLQDFAPTLTIVASGDTNTDIFLSSICRDGDMGNVAFLWVESYLQAGHMVFQISSEDVSLIDLHPPPSGQYRFQVSQAASLEQETGCNTNYTPYSAMDLHLFVADAAKQIIQWLVKPPSKLTAVRWKPGSSGLESAL